jgi:hypothetical protein
MIIKNRLRGRNYAYIYFRIAYDHCIRNAVSGFCHGKIERRLIEACTQGNDSHVKAIFKVIPVCWFNKYRLAEALVRTLEYEDKDETHDDLLIRTLAKMQTKHRITTIIETFAEYKISCNSYPQPNFSLLDHAILHARLTNDPFYVMLLLKHGAKQESISDIWQATAGIENSIPANISQAASKRRKTESLEDFCHARDQSSIPYRGG